MWLQVVSLSFIICHLSFSRVAAQTFTATVVDARNGHPLSFASVYARPGVSTITNAEGQFAIACDSADVLRISYVGFQSKNVRAGRLGGRVGLQPMDLELQEVTVYPIASLIRKVTKETLRQLQKNKKRKSQFFYRQTAFSDSTCYEFAEAFLQGHSAAWLRDLELVKGRYAAIRPDSLHYYSYYSNFYTFSQIEVAMKSNDWRDVWKMSMVPPLMPRYRDFYKVDYEIISDAESRLIAIHFTPKPKIRDAILDVTIYVDEATCHLRKMEGVGRNVYILHRDWVSNVRKKQVVFPTEFGFVVNMTEENGFLEVQSVSVNERHVFQGQQIDTHSILFNVGELQKEKGKKLDRGDEMKFYGNLHGTIQEQGYDAQFWRNNEVVLRTPVEQQVMQLFERDNLFGVFK